MGKIYRISYNRYRSWVDPNSRGLVILSGSLVILFSLALELTGIAYTGGLALGLLSTPLFLIFFFGLFLDDHPKTVTYLLLSLCSVMLLLSVGSTIYYIHHVLIGAESPTCRWDYEHCTEWARYQQILKLRSSAAHFMVDVLPLLATIVFFSFATFQHASRKIHMTT